MLWSLLFPRRCVFCKKIGEGYLCAACIEKISFTQIQHCPDQTCNKPSINGIVHPSCRKRYTLDGHISVTEYEDVMQSIIEFYKRRKVTKLEATLEQIVSYYFAEPEPPFPFSLDVEQIGVPVPLFWIDQRLRGFNTAERIGEMVARALDIPFSNNILAKSKPTRSQKHLTRKDRLSNIQGSLTVTNPDMVRDKEVVLIDDIWTTGATMQECAKVLKKAGARAVWGVTLTRGV